MIVTLETWKRIARLGHAASDDPDRPVLHGIHLTVKGVLMTGTATDSYVLATNEVMFTREKDDPKTWEGLLHGRQAILVEKDVRSLELYRSKKDHPDSSLHLRVTIADDWVDVTLADDGSMFDVESITRRLDPINGTFPEFGTLLDDPIEGGPSAVWVNPEKLTQVAKTVAEDSWPIRFHVQPGRSPVHCTVLSEPSWRGLVMPVSAVEE